MFTADIDHFTTQSVILSSEFNEIADAYDPPSQALTEMVRQVANRLELDVCSVYILEPDGHHLCLAATMGLNQCSVGQLRMHVTEGLAGLVAEQGQPVTVAEAPAHPRFKYFPDAGEDRFRSFLGIPIIDSGLLQGVLVAQTIDARDFQDTEFVMLSASAGALAPHVTRCRSCEYAMPGTESL